MIFGVDIYIYILICSPIFYFLLCVSLSTFSHNCFFHMLWWVMPHLQLGIHKYSSLILVTTAYTQVLKQDSLLGKSVTVSCKGIGLNNSIVTVCQSKKCLYYYGLKRFWIEYFKYMFKSTFCSHLQIIKTVYPIKFEIFKILDLSIFSVYGHGAWSLPLWPLMIFWISEFKKREEHLNQSPSENLGPGLRHPRLD